MNTKTETVLVLMESMLSIRFESTLSYGPNLVKTLYPQDGILWRVLICSLFDLWQQMNLVKYDGTK